MPYIHSKSALTPSTRLLGLHPATWLLCWVAFLLVAADFSLTALAVCCAVLWLIAHIVGANPLLALRRMRWVMIAGLVIFAFATPGAPIWPAAEIYSPTINGLDAGVRQMLRLLAAVIGLAFIMARLHSQGVLMAMDWLFRPLCFKGRSPDRLIARLSLTLHYLEPARQQTFSELLSQLNGPMEASTSVVTAPRQSASWKDGLLLLLVTIAVFSFP